MSRTSPRSKRSRGCVSFRYGDELKDTEATRTLADTVTGVNRREGSSAHQRTAVRADRTLVRLATPRTRRACCPASKAPVAPSTIAQVSALTVGAVPGLCRHTQFHTHCWDSKQSERQTRLLELSHAPCSTTQPQKRVEECGVLCRDVHCSDRYRPCNPRTLASRHTRERVLLSRSHARSCSLHPTL